MTLITSWNIAPNLEWFARFFNLGVTHRFSLYLTEIDAKNNTNVVLTTTYLSSTGKINYLLPIEFEYLGKTYTIGKYDPYVNYYVKVSGTGDKICKIGPFYDIPSEEHPIYKNADIAGSRALMLINERTHIEHTYNLTLPILEDFELFQVANVISNRIKPTTFNGQIEGISYELSTSKVLSNISVNRYELMSKQAIS